MNDPAQRGGRLSRPLGFRVVAHRGAASGGLLFAAAVVAVAASAAHANMSTAPGVRRTARTIVVRDDLQSVFGGAGTQGTFALLDVSSQRLTVVDRARAERRAVPASTFKIPHALIALQTGVVHDANEVLPYGGAPQPVKAWEHDMNLTDAIRQSNAAIFQQIARRLGRRRENEWLQRLMYGNRQVGSRVDRFWLDGPLEISPVEQVEFLAKLAQRQLPFSNKVQDTVIDILSLERTPEFALYGKTGWRFDTTPPQLGWWVGWVVRHGQIYTFALNMDINKDADAEQRIPLGRKLMALLDVLPAHAF
jgi:beta-lactamase class D